MLTLNLPRDHSELLVHELSMAGRREIGGILMGEQLAPGQFKVTEITVQRHGGLFAQFVRNARTALTSLQQFFGRTGHQYSTFNYLGEWHSHPSFAPIPSATDHRSMTDMAVHQATGANFVLLMIARLGEDRRLEGSVTVYLPDGAVGQGTLDIETDNNHMESENG